MNTNNPAFRVGSLTGGNQLAFQVTVKRHAKLEADMKEGMTEFIKRTGGDLAVLEKSLGGFGDRMEALESTFKKFGITDK